MLNINTAHDSSSAKFSSSGAFQEVGIIIPTYNAAGYWKRLNRSLRQQGIPVEQVLIVDSSSTDGTRTLARRAGYRVDQIPKASFRHGLTRQLAVSSMPWARILVFLTQDAIPAGDSSIADLVRTLEDPEVGAVYGRQVPREEANAIERHARFFNYPSVSEVRTLESRLTIGFKAAFFSNSFGAYRRTALEEVGGFPDTILCEDSTVAARMLMANWKIMYQADAVATHSHPFTILEEFERYFDIGVHHGREKWLMETFGGAGGEGRTFVVSQMQYLLKSRASLIPLALVRTASKLFGYQLGRREKYLPLGLKEMLSGQPNFWRDERAPRSANLEEDAQAMEVSSALPIHRSHSFR